MRREEIAERTWPVLVAAAINRQLLTYDMVGPRVGMPAVGLGMILAYIMNYCDHKHLPPLTVLVVNKDTGRPGVGLLTSADIDRDRERVFQHNWLTIIAPFADDLKHYAPLPESGS